MPPVPGGSEIGIADDAAPVKGSVAGALPPAAPAAGAMPRPLGSVDESVENARTGCAGRLIWVTSIHTTTDVVRFEPCIVSLLDAPRDGCPARAAGVAVRV